jgi:hypothetical protein
VPVRSLWPLRASAVRKNGLTFSRSSSKFTLRAEDNLQKQIKEGKAENADLDHLRYERLGVEIDLEVLRRGMAE